MTQATLRVLAMLLMAGLYASQGMAADSASNVRIALLDGSAVARGSMPGWSNSPAPGGQYGNMMGNGYGAMGGYGMMGSSGYGMMGAGNMGMMGMMAIRTDQNSVKAGDITFDVTNWSRSVVHEVIIVAVDNADAPIPYDYNKLQVPEEQVKVVADSGELAPSVSKTLAVKLSPGSYLLLCNVPGHFAAGMSIPLTVTP